MCAILARWVLLALFLDLKPAIELADDPVGTSNARDAIITVNTCFKSKKRMFGIRQPFGEPHKTLVQATGQHPM
jgi:hypothetical protein